MSDENPLLQRAVALNGEPDTIRDFYSDWSQSYDKDLLEDIGYVGPIVVADALCASVAADAVILDAGCGTGLVGLELLKRKPGLKVDGIDLTPAMLTESGKKGCYRKLMEADMAGHLTMFEDNSYDGIVSAGVFTDGHVGPDGLDELLRIAKPGAPVVLTVRDTAWEKDGFKAKIEGLTESGLIEAPGISHSPYHTKEDVFCRLVTLRPV